MPRLRKVIYKEKHATVKIRRSKGKTATPHPPLELGGDAYTGKRHLKQKVQDDLGFSLDAFCFDCYVNKLKSCQEIRDELALDYGVDVTRQYVWLLLKRYPGILRSQSESMKIRAITGRMDYAKTTKHINYKDRKIDYKHIVEKRKDGIAANDTKIIELVPEEIIRLKKIANDNKLTISDTIRMRYYPNSKFRKFIVRLPQKYR